MKQISEEQQTALTNAREALNEAVFASKETYILETISASRKVTESVSRAEYLEFLIGYAQEQLSVFEEE